MENIYSWLKEHINAVHDGLKPFQCHFCDKSFPTSSALNQHVFSVHEGKRPFKCDICDQKFKRKTHLKSHLKSIHKDTNVEDIIGHIVP